MQATRSTTDVQVISEDGCCLIVHRSEAAHIVVNLLLFGSFDVSAVDWLAALHQPPH